MFHKSLKFRQTNNIIRERERERENKERKMQQACRACQNFLLLFFLFLYFLVCWLFDAFIDAQHLTLPSSLPLSHPFFNQYLSRRPTPTHFELKKMKMNKYRSSNCI